SDLARIYVGAPVAHADMPANTTVSTLSSTSFTVSHNATGTQAAASITVTGQFFTGNLSSGSSIVTGVSQTDLAKLFVGAPLSSTNLSANTTVASIGSGSFTMSHNASGTASGAIIALAGQATTYSWDEDNRLTQVSLPGGITVSYQYDSLGRMLTRTHSV